jgi:hypothetical protein
MNAIQLAALQRRLRQRQMPAMDGIERPAKKSNIHVEEISLPLANINENMNDNIRTRI